MVVHHYTPRGELGSTVVYSTVVARTVHCDPAATLNAPHTDWVCPQDIMGETAQLRTLGIEDPVRLRLDKLANLLRDVGEVTAARALYEQVIEGQTVYRGAHHIDTLTSKGNLAVLLRDVGEVAAARALYEEVIAGQTAQSGADHIDTLTTKGNLADLLTWCG